MALEPSVGLAHRRTLLTLLAAASSFLIFMTSEHFFERADLRNAVELVQTLPPRPGAPTIPQALVDRHPGTRLQDIEWSATLTDQYYGFVRVRAQVGSDAYVFDVNLAGQRPHPGNDKARALLADLGGAPPAAGAPSTTAPPD